MHNDNIKEVSPVSSHHVCHSFIPARRWWKADCNRTVYPYDESEWTRANDGLHLHKAKRTVGDEEEFLSMTNQSMQNSLRLLPSQNELIYEEPVDRMLFYVQQCAGWIQKEERVFLPRSSMIHLYMYPLRWTMPIASWGLNKRRIETTHPCYSKLSWHFLRYGIFTEKQLQTSKRSYPFYINTYSFACFLFVFPTTDVMVTQ